MIDAATVARQSSSLSWRARLRAGARHVLNLGLPPLCPTCREPVADQGGLCAQCWSKLSFIARPYCERLGVPFAYDPGPGILSMEAIADPPTYNRARAAVRYDDTARTMVQAFKYGDRLDLAPAMGRWMAQAGHELLTEADALIPVPLHWRRLWMRRFNQAATLAKTISLLSGVPVAHHVLRRVRATPQQVGLTQAERAVNVQGAFRVPTNRRLEVTRPAAGARGRRPDIRRNPQYLRTNFAPGWSRQCRRAGIRQGCPGAPQRHIVQQD